MALTDKTIMVNVSRHSKYDERPAEAAIMPGVFLSRTSNNTFLPYPYGVAHKYPETPIVIAVENTALGGTIDTEYEAGEKVIARVLLPGDVVLAWCGFNNDVGFSYHNKLHRYGSGPDIIPPGYLYSYPAFAGAEYKPTALALEESPPSPENIRMRVEILRS